MMTPDLWAWLGVFALVLVIGRAIDIWIRSKQVEHATSIQPDTYADGYAFARRRLETSNATGDIRILRYTAKYLQSVVDADPGCEFCRGIEDFLIEVQAPPRYE